MAVGDASGSDFVPHRPAAAGTWRVDRRSDAGNLGRGTNHGDAAGDRASPPRRGFRRGPVRTRIDRPAGRRSGGGGMTMDAAVACRPRRGPVQALRLHIGCGPKVLPGWVNIDRTARADGVVTDIDLTALPFGDSAVDEIL